MAIDWRRTLSWKRLRIGNPIRMKRQMCVPDGIRVYAIGDIHGQLDLLKALHKRIADDLKERPVEECILVYLGDYVDRGLDTKGVISALIRGAAIHGEAHYLKGNHEDALLTFMEDPGFLLLWRDYGGLETLRSYGVEVPPYEAGGEDAWAHDLQARFAAALPKTHLAFLRGLKLSYEKGDFYFAHAGVRPGVPLADQKAADLLWIREPFLSSRRFHGKMIVHGHTPQEQPVIKTNRIGIDTGAYITGALSAVAIEGTTFRFLQARRPTARTQNTAAGVAQAG
jgi:serine/threonine protein phosphatase 1